MFSEIVRVSKHKQTFSFHGPLYSAVSHLHANGIMHRDLKPENIFLDAEGHVMLTDFGVAKQFDESTRSNSMCGTLEYMSPEIVQGRGHDKAADWWRVGILMYEMLTGKPPFRGGNRQKIHCAFAGKHPGGLGVPAVGMAIPGYVTQPNGMGNSEMTWLPVLVGVVGAFG
uniref:Protein kinase domain-containing protein n=1 Tax=Lactuca sativa TaxID=4236 RepID=A0A9R1VUB3_LACSA|nr:hypothetical protein LSAT_V11C400199800 [Lactuca sativa]